MTLIRVWSLMRSGHHAIINWLLSSYEYDTLFINNCKPVDKYHYASINGSIQKRSFNFEQVTNYEVVLINFEHVPLNKSKVREYSKWRKLYTKFTCIYDVIVIRDPYNWVASCMSKKTFKETVTIDMEQWKQYAMEVLNKSILPNHICIMFNKWVSDPLYREEIANKFCIKSNESTVTKLATRSSFTGRLFEDNANEMKVNSRWKVFKDNTTYRNYVKSKSIKQISNRLFSFSVNGF